MLVRAPGELESILGEFREFLERLSHVAPVRSDEDAGTVLASEPPRRFQREFPAAWTPGIGATVSAETTESHS